MLDLRWLLGVVLAVASWSAPEPLHAQGLLVVYGGQQLVEANADWHGYDLKQVPGRCGLAAISPAHLGQLAWVRVPGRPWQGPCVVVDAVARTDALESIYVRHEIAEVSRVTARALGFEYGAPGEIWFGSCPPPAGSRAVAYHPAYALDAPPYDWTPSFYPYSEQAPTIDCSEGDLYARSARNRAVQSP